MDKAKLRWGILGTAQIARKNWKAIWNSGNGRVSAVASRELKRSQRFIDECQAHARFDPTPMAFGGYDQLLASREVDAVYLPLPTRVREPWVKRAAEAGKHVVCEKPCATSVAALREMLEVCRRHQVQFLDGVMFVHSGRLGRIREVLEDGQTVGRLRRISSAFTFNQEAEFFASNIRARSELEPDGCLGDLGWYCIRFALWTMNGKLPQHATGRLLSEWKHAASDVAVPTEFSGELFFEGGVSSAFYCSFITEIEQWAILSGSRGHLQVPDFVLPFLGNEIAFETGNPRFRIEGCDFNLEAGRQRHQVAEASNSHPNSQESNLFRRFADQVQSQRLDPTSWPDLALKTQQVMEACRESSRAQGQPVKLD